MVLKIIGWSILTLVVFGGAWQSLSGWLGAGPLPPILAAIAAVLVCGASVWAYRMRVPDIVLPPTDRSGVSKPLGVMSLMLGVIAVFVIWTVRDFAFDPRTLLTVAGGGVGVGLAFCGLGLVVNLEATEAIAMQDLAAAEARRVHARQQLSQGAVVQAIQSYEAVLAVERRYRPPSHARLVEALTDLTNALLHAKRYQAAHTYATEARQRLDLVAARMPGVLTSLAIAQTERVLGRACLGLRDHAGAKTHFEAAAVLLDQIMQAGRTDGFDRLVYGEDDEDLPIVVDLNQAIAAADMAGEDAWAIDQHARLLAMETQWVRSRRLDSQMLASLQQDAALKSLAYRFVAPDKAVRAAQRMYALAAADGAPLANAHDELGLAWCDCGALAVAAFHLGRKLTLLQDDQGADTPGCSSTLCDLARIAALRGDHTDAVSLFERALVCAQRDGDLAVLGTVSLALAEALLAAPALAPGADERVRSLLKAALRVSDATLIRAGTYSALGEMHARRGLPDLAILLGKRAVNLVQAAAETARGSALEARYWAHAAPLARRLATHLVDAGRLAEAQRVLDLLKEDEFEDRISRSGGGRTLSLVQLTIREVTWTRHGDAIEAAIATLTSERSALLAKADRTAADTARLDALAGMLDAAKQQLDDWLDELADVLLAERPAAQEQVRALNLDLLETLRADLSDLGPDVALVHFILGTRRLAIILTRPDLQVSRDVAVTDVEMHGLIHRFRRALRTPGRDTTDVLRLANALYRHLIAPIAEHLTEVETLMVVLDGALRYLPLAALHDGTDYLIARHALAILTPAATTRLKDRPVDWTVGGLGVSRHLAAHAALPAIDDELRAIIREPDETEGIFPGKRYMDDAFTAAALAEALQSHKAIHIASHFEFAAANTGESALLLGDGSELTLRQMQADRYVFRNIDLVALSACETALGTEANEQQALRGLRRMNGAEFESLGAMIQRRGAKAVIATLWAVEDNSTALLMRLFYAAHRDGKTKAAALRSAQVAVLRSTAEPSYANPYFWAPFVLMGNWL